VQEKSTMKLALVVLLPLSTVLPAWAQTKPMPKTAVARTGNCAPIGRTADGQLVYSMKCDNLPAPAAPPPQAQAVTPPAQAESPPEEPVVQHSGLFGFSYTVKQPSQ
jgi:hypothetical protein